MCPNGPILTKESSAIFLNSDPCFNKNNSKGNYSMDCLQAKFTSVGGSQSGSGFPSTKEKADALMKDANGNLLDINDIVNIIYDKVVQASTGKTTDGIPLTIQQWNEQSMWAFGKRITTPCDVPTPEGTISKDCLSFLYNTQGTGTGIGSTYSLPRRDYATMLNNDIPNTFCRPGAPLDPSTQGGFERVKNMRNIEEVKGFYDSVYRTANDNKLSNNERNAALNDCYGLNFGY
jgi:hypothetical protein